MENTQESDIGARTLIHGVLCIFAPFFLDGGVANLVQIVVLVKHVNLAVAYGAVLESWRRGTVRRSYFSFARDKACFDVWSKPFGSSIYF